MKKLTEKEIKIAELDKEMGRIADKFNKAGIGDKRALVERYLVLAEQLGKLKRPTYMERQRLKFLKKLLTATKRLKAI